MFVSFISFVLVLSVSVSRAAAKNNVALKDQLEKSIIHVSEMLVDMEGKIEREREILSQIDNDLNHKERVHDVLPTHSDYDSVTDIWWSSTNTTGHHMDDAAVTAATATPGKYGNVTITIITTPSLFPRPSTKSTFPTPPSNWHLESTTISPFIADLKQNMALNNHGYFTAFAERFMGLMYTKDMSVIYPVVSRMVTLTLQNADNGTFNSLGPDLLKGLTGKLAWFASLTNQRIKEQAGVAHYTLKIMDNTLSDSLKSLLRFYDNMFTKEEGEELFESLEQFYVYPEGNVTILSTGERMLNALIAPYIKSEGKRNQKRFIQHILMTIHELDPYFRASSMSLLKNSDTAANHSMKDLIQPAFPERRSINYKKIVKHFLVKHPKLFRKIKRQYKHDKKNEHHRFSHTRKRHHNYRKSRGGNHRHKRLYDREQTRERAYTESNYESENEEVEADSSESGAYYRENSKVYQQKNIHRVQSTQKNKIRLDKLNQKQRNGKQKQWNLLKGTRSTTKLYQDDPQYLNQLAIRFLRNKQQRQNFYKNRRFNIPSSEEEICNHSQNFQDSKENDLLHKIRDASSYSDEEDHLRNNLYDALRHGNRTFVLFRKSDGGINNEQTHLTLPSETDDEWVLKNNIYKVFEQKKK